MCVTDGPWQLKQQLADEGWRKAVPLPPFFIRFFDLQTHFAGSYPAASPPPLCAADMAAALALPPPPAPPHPALGRVTTMAAVVCALLRDGHPFLVPELACELDFSARPPAPGALLCDGVPAGCLLRLRGLPWAAREADVARFLDGVELLPGSRVRLVTDGGGRVTGEAFVQVVGPAAVAAAVSSHHRRLLGRRYVEVFRSSPWEMSVHLARAEAEGDRESSRPPLNPCVALPYTHPYSTRSCGVGSELRSRLSASSMRRRTPTCQVMFFPRVRHRSPRCRCRGTRGR